MITNTKPTLTRAKVLWATLVGEGVTTILGYPGGAILQSRCTPQVCHPNSHTSRYLKLSIFGFPDDTCCQAPTPSISII